MNADQAEPVHDRREDDDGYGEDYGNRLRTRVSYGNHAATAVCVTLGASLAIFGPQGSDNVALAIGSLFTLAGMFVKNTSTIVDYLFGGSSRDK